MTSARRTNSRIVVGLLALAALLMAALLMVNPTKAAAGEVAILESSVTGGLSSVEANAVVAAGKTPVIISAAAWATMTTADFADYDAIVIGDPTCQTGGVVPNATANAAVWGAAVNGPVVIVGSDPVFHQSQGGATLTNKGIAFAVSDSAKTGAYITLSCYYHFSPSGTPETMLDAAFGSTGDFVLTGANFIPGLNNVHIVATHPALTGLTDAQLSNWGNSVHEGFNTWPLDFEVLAIAVDSSGSHVATDGTRGYPYIIARGVSVISDIDLSPEDATNPVGTSHELTATVTTDDPSPGTPVVGTTVTFTVVSGPHAGTMGTDTTDASGQATFSYVGTAAGIDLIEATFVDASGATQRSNRVTKTWEDVSGPIETCDDLLISGYKTSPASDQWVELANVGDEPIDIGGCSFVTYNAFTEKSIGAATRNLSGVLDPGDTVVLDLDNTMPTGPGGIAVLDIPAPANGTPVTTILANDVTGMVYLNSSTVYGVSHLAVPAHNAIYDCIYGGHGTGPFSGPFDPLASCFP